MKINKKILKQFNPCQCRWDNYLEHYSDFDGSLYEFLCLDKISVEDKHWVMNRKWDDKKLQRIQRYYALICADRATFDSTPEVKEFFLLCAFINVSEMFELGDTKEFSSADRSARRSAYYSTDWSARRSAYYSTYYSTYYSAYYSADWSADRSAEREIQIEIFKSLLQTKG
jgi:hypothetical protein